LCGVELPHPGKRDERQDLVGERDVESPPTGTRGWELPARRLSRRAGSSGQLYESSLSHVLP